MPFVHNLSTMKILLFHGVDYTFGFDQVINNDHFNSKNFEDHKIH